METSSVIHAAVSPVLFAASILSFLSLTGRESPRKNAKVGVRKKVSQAVDESDLNVIDEGKEKRRRILHPSTVTITYTSTTGTCQRFADRLRKQVTLLSKYEHVELSNISDHDWWDEFLGEDSASLDESDIPVLLIILPTWSHGEPPPDAKCLLDALREIATDWRVAPNPLARKLHVGVFGMGSSAYDEKTFCRPAIEVCDFFGKLGVKGISLGMGDGEAGDCDKVFNGWMETLIEGGFTADVNHQHAESETETEEDDDWSDEDEEEKEEPNVVDMEDMGSIMKKSKASKRSKEVKEMVTPSQAKALKKEGYKLIGTHSAVKLCRWTKHQLRGRGGCYKHTFYGITSYQCMEATPSLACANKCVFCWRHHKNPVGKEWRWKTDDPVFIVENAVKEHVHMIKETKGIPGVQFSRWLEAHTVRHCALSLVGEPIMYPHINPFLEELHKRRISTFLVTNGQHPDAIESLVPVTQLYVSVDAPTKTSLIEIDRPLFEDAWERLRISLKSLKMKGQRTVARLTVVKGWNFDEIEGYAELISLGLVSLVEIKGVTFCGKSDASNLNMSNSPWHHEVVSLAKTLVDHLDKIPGIPKYGLACEHKHSVSVLLARKDLFYINNKWMTWIDYDKFDALARQKYLDPTFRFGVSDYLAETPSWALSGSHEEGFDPTDTRKFRKKKKYTEFDEDGIPTRDHNKEPLDEAQRALLRATMEGKRRELSKLGVTRSRKGEKTVVDVSLMFRSMVIK